MGQQQSRQQDLAKIQKLTSQLKAMEWQHISDSQELEKQWVQVDGENPPAYSSGSQTLSVSTVEAWEKELMADAKNRLALSALTSNPLSAIIGQKSATLSDTQTFNVKIPFEGAPITNQRSSGRCWLFASTNVFRVAIMKKHNLESFELSQAYLFFWDKLEKSNYFLEQILDTVDEDLDSRLVQELLSAPVNDGGQWDMVANLVAKYGLVPQTLYPDSYNASNSSVMGRLITTKLREFALILRSMASKKNMTRASVHATKEKMMQEVHLILTLMLGPPPNPNKEFAWEYYDKNGKYHKVNKSPLSFSRELSSPSTIRSLSGSDVNSLFSLVNDPRNPYNTHLTVSRLGNVYGGRPVTYVNVSMPVMKQAAIRMLQGGLPVFFGSDVGKYSDSSSGIMDTAIFDYSLAFNVDLNMSKSQRLKTGESAMTHAMVLTAVQVEDGKSVRWRVQNSWGEAAGEKGWFVMTDKWMDEFCYQVVVDPGFVSQEIRDVLDQEPTVLPLWDPMGALA